MGQRLFSTGTRLRLAWVCFIAHVAANLVMLLVLIRGIPPGPLDARRAFVAAHPTAWALGWVVWMLTSGSLILLYLAIAETLPRSGWTILGVILACAGATLDWGVLGITGLVAPQWASLAAADPFYANLYAAWDRVFLILSVGVDHLLYSLGGIVLGAVASQTPDFPKWLTRFTAVMWSTSLVLAVAAFSGQEAWIVPASALTFSLFLPWILLLGYRWLALDQPNEVTK